MKTNEIVEEMAALYRRKGYEMEEIITAIEIVKTSIIKGYLEA